MSSLGFSHSLRLWIPCFFPMQDIVIPGSLDLIEALKVAFCLNHAHTHTHINGINVGALYIIHIDTLLVV